MLTHTSKYCLPTFLAIILFFRFNVLDCKEPLRQNIDVLEYAAVKVFLFRTFLLINQIDLVHTSVCIPKGQKLKAYTDTTTEKLL